MTETTRDCADPYPNVTVEKPIPAETAVDAVLGAATALEAPGSTAWSPHWITRLRETAELIRWYESELEEVRRITDEEAAALHAELDAAGVPQAHEIEGVKHPLDRIFNSSTFETVNRLRWLRHANGGEGENHDGN